MSRTIALQFTEEVMNSFPRPVDYLTNVVDTFVTNVKLLAQDSLHTSRQDYINAIHQSAPSIVGDKVLITVSLEGDFPNMLEDGHAPYDMKPDLLKGLDHRSIFIRKGTPSSIRFQRLSPKQHELMKSLPTKGAPFPAFLTKGKKPNVTAYGVSKKHSGEITGYEKGHHKGHIYGKMQKIVRGKTPTYGTFRTVSVNSDKDAWYHPGFEAFQFFELALRQMGLE